MFCLCIWFSLLLAFLLLLSLSPLSTLFSGSLCVSLSSVWRYGLCAKQETTWYLVMWCMQMISLSRLLILIWQHSELSGPLYIGNQICNCQLQGEDSNVCVRAPTRVCVWVWDQARQSKTGNRWRHASEGEREASQDRHHISKRREDGYERERECHLRPVPSSSTSPHTHSTPPVLVLFSRAVSFKNAIETWIKRKGGGKKCFGENGMSQLISITSCSIFIMCNNLTNQRI